ncbi:VCBS repeat-containing protein [Clostridium tagluense]|uniref:VCBS repeat-containing protein n=1 Tax=Clostridium tagluense TaxID=360422 RepID=UPI001CF3F9F2|nr:VCBS repeat-containing protein [Clostridium tagluense]MCB2309691.1 VCBS repeat-containing protein [Clostridium tagluense]MCB2314779.1 VCBS repeat-containing protein [Clostridium tagluense]MCB2319628.1 VCBS repeat-containing protein [Clostridium tagluense]MCB2324285.1 VCBS repeat-containing protein [Clostridium tagluense]MCB2329136.1 VCBS repeat-containing protein [Clostridium tagluense]
MYNCYFRANMMHPEIVSYARGDVNGDGIPDNVYLTGIKTADSQFTRNITLVIQDIMTGGLTSVPLSENAGYNPTLFLGDFTGDGVKDILIGITTGGSGGITYDYIYSFINNTAQLLFDFNLYNEQYQYDVTYKDSYKVEVVSKKNNEKYIIDISNKDADYLNEIYDDNGKLKNAITGFVNPLSGLYPVDFDSNKVYELLAYQKIAGRYNADSLGYVLNTLKWKDSMFVLDSQQVAIFGAQA